MAEHNGFLNTILKSPDVSMGKWTDMSYNASLKRQKVIAKLDPSATHGFMVKNVPKSHVLNLMEINDV